MVGTPLVDQRRMFDCWSKPISDFHVLEVYLERLIVFFNFFLCDVLSGLHVVVLAAHGIINLLQPLAMQLHFVNVHLHEVLAFQRVEGGAALEPLCNIGRRRVERGGVGRRLATDLHLHLDLVRAHLG